jgi:LAO/AO transport system kinase
VTRSLAERVIAGDPRAIARAISLIEDEHPDGADLVRVIFGRTGQAYLVGVTGPPGAGKSTLVDRLTAEVRRAGQSVGIIAVDPTSPFTGGAVLGDRLRMQAHASDEAVFIRSMATRGHLGGLARATGDAALVLDAAGKALVIIETVGVGQDEVDIVRTADVTVVTLVPGAGDEVQALKAGIMEIADVFVVNKADREGADRLVAAIEANLALQAYDDGEWRPPIVKTVATSGTGVAELLETIWKFRDHAARLGARAGPRVDPREDPSSRSGVPGPKAASDPKVGSAAIRNLEQRRRERIEYRLRELVSQKFMHHLEGQALDAGELASVVDRVAAREIDPYTAANDLLTRALDGSRRL